MGVTLLLHSDRNSLEIGMQLQQRVTGGALLWESGIISLVQGGGVSGPISYGAPGADLVDSGAILAERTERSNRGIC